MNDNEYAYLGKLVAALLADCDDTHPLLWKQDDCAYSVLSPAYVDVDAELGDGLTPIAALEAALTALGIALPERGEWHPCNREDPTTWPEEGRALVLTIKRLGLDRETVRGFLSNETFMYPYGYRLHSSIQILAWMYDTLPEPYQEATP